MSNSCILSIDKILTNITTVSQSGPGSNGDEKVFYIPQSSKTGASPSYGLEFYPEHLLVGVGRSYPFAEMQSVYSTAPTNWAQLKWGGVKKSACCHPSSIPEQRYLHFM